MLITILIVSIILQSLLLVLSKHPIIAILTLISIYISCALILVILGSDFLAIITILIYVGAVAILFIFVIIMLNQRLVTSYNSITDYKKIGLVLIIMFFLQFIYFIRVSFYGSICRQHTHFRLTITEFTAEDSERLIYQTLHPILDSMSKVLYNQLSIFVYVAGLLLLLAMIGAIAVCIKAKVQQSVDGQLSKPFLYLEKKEEQALEFEKEFKKQIEFEKSDDPDGTNISLMSRMSEYVYSEIVDSVYTFFNNIYIYLKKKFNQTRVKLAKKKKK